MAATFSSLAVPTYRRYAAGGVISNTGTWMGRVAQDWLVLTELTDHSSTALGTVTGLQFLPFLLLAPWTGMLADRFPKRRILLVSQTVLMVSASLLAGLTLAGVVQLWQVYLLATVQGVATAVDNPARQTFVSETVGPELLANAVALNSASFNLGRLTGPGVAGLLIAAYGTGWTLVANAASFLAVIVALLSIRREGLLTPALARGRGRIREGLAYVRTRWDIKLVLVLVFVLGTFGMNFQLTMALMATTVFGKGATEYGLLGSIMALGSLSAALLSARRDRARLRVLLAALAAFVVTSAAAALAPTYAVFGLALAGCGLTALTALTTANAYVQSNVDPTVRGRVMALYLAIFLGGTPVGSPLVGWLGDVAGARWAIGVGSVSVGLTLLVVGVALLRRDNVTVSYAAQRPHVRVSIDPRHPEVPTDPTPEATR